MRLPWPIRDPLLTHRALAARAGDPAAMRALYRELYPELARFIGRRVRAPADAEELVARVLLVLVERLADFDPRRGSLRGWLLRIARNAVIDHHRAQQRRPEHDPRCDRLPAPAQASDPLTILLEREGQRHLHDQLDRLDPELRELLTLRYGDGLRHRQIAEICGLSEDAVKQRISRAIRQLRRRLDPLVAQGAVDVPASS